MTFASIFTTTVLNPNWVMIGLAILHCNNFMVLRQSPARFSAFVRPVAYPCFAASALISVGAEGLCRQSCKDRRQGYWDRGKSGHQYPAITPTGAATPAAMLCPMSRLPVHKPGDPPQGDTAIARLVIIRRHLEVSLAIALHHHVFRGHAKDLGKRQGHRFRSAI